MKNNEMSRLAEILSERSMTQKDLAAATGITEAAISHYVNGTRIPRGVNLTKIAKALGTTTDYLLNHDQSMDAENEIFMIKTLVARNSEKMTKEQKVELVGILFGNN